MNVTMLLADHAQTTDGKLNLIGGGWTITPAAENAVGFGIAVIAYVPWDRTNERIDLLVALRDADGNQVHLGQNPITLEIAIEAGRPPGAIKGNDLPQVIAVNVNQLPLPPGTYEWVCLDADENVLARCPFSAIAL